MINFLNCPDLQKTEPISVFPANIYFWSWCSYLYFPILWNWNWSNDIGSLRCFIAIPTNVAAASMILFINCSFCSRANKCCKQVSYTVKWFIFSVLFLMFLEKYYFLGGCKFMECGLRCATYTFSLRCKFIGKNIHNKNLDNIKINVNKTWWQALLRLYWGPQKRP